ncbi:hypothetical protein CES77_17880 [Vibrio cholerae]|nr:hypothetical protein [Vibrio cholerae]EGR5575239.1 hypothetical protein [Vibrio cholerae]
MKVRNINGTSDNKCECTSWLAHWEKFSGKKAGTCVEKTCTENAVVGAHVQKDSSTDKSWYIIPLCQSHNKKADEMELYGSPTLVSANVSQTCGK